MTRLALLTAASILALTACAPNEQATGVQLGPDDAWAPAEGDGTSMVLDQTEQGVSGTMTSASGTVDFESVNLTPDGDVVQVTFRVNGAVLTRVHSLSDRATIVDGFAEDNGGDTYLTAEDEALIEQFIDLAQLEGVDRSTHAGDYLMRSAQSWLMHEAHHLLAYELFDHREDRDHAPHGNGCSYMTGANYGTYWVARHDGWHLWSSEWDHERSEWYIGARYTEPGLWSNTTYTYEHGQWYAAENDDHNDITDGNGSVLQDGLCMGRCGEGCTGNLLDGYNTDTIYTWDCLEHDVCVRNGHNMGAGSCDDELFGHGGAYNHEWNGAMWDQENEYACDV